MDTSVFKICFKELDRLFNIDESIMRSMTVKLDHEPVIAPVVEEPVVEAVEEVAAPAVEEVAEAAEATDAE